SFPEHSRYQVSRPEACRSLRNERRSGRSRGGVVESGGRAMPLMDHFHPPLSRRLPWTTLHAGWAVRIADNLNDRWLSPGFVASEYATSAAHPEIGIATYEDPRAAPPAPGNGPPVASAAAPAWAAPAPVVTVPALYPHGFEVRVHLAEGDQRLVGV